MYTEREIKQIVDTLDVFDKYKVYIDDFVNDITPSIVWYDHPLYKKLKGLKNVEVKTKHLLVGKIARPVSFEEFISDRNYEEIPLGDNWQQRGFAQPYFVHMGGIYSRLYKRQHILLPKLTFKHEKDSIKT